jgi:tetratricopeptide (TPR) repeat protein
VKEAALLSRNVTIFILLAACGLSARATAADTPQATAPRIAPEARGDLYMVRKQYREAIDAYREGGSTAILEDKIGIAWHQLGQPQMALKSYQKAVKLDPKYADAINNVGTVYYAEKRYRRAISEYKRALILSPGAAAIWSNLGTAYYARRRFPDMSEAYAKALQLDPTVFDARNGAGTQMQDRGVEEKARYHFEMARIYAKAGRNDMALQYLRKSLEEGFKDKEKIDKQPEFADLRETPEFKDLMTLEPRVL